MLLNDFFNIERLTDSGDCAYAADIRLNASHKIFQAHFPGHPITPGVCQLQIVGELLADHLGHEVRLTDVKTVKYMAVISPVDTPCLEVRFKKIAVEGATCKVQATIEAGGRVYTKMSMTYVVRDNTDI